jgi:hypothetical protein
VDYFEIAGDIAFVAELEGLEVKHLGDTFFIKQEKAQILGEKLKQSGYVVIIPKHMDAVK